MLKEIEIQEIEKKIAAAEKQSSAEIVLLIKEQSGTYPQTQERLGIWGTLIAHSLLLFLPYWQESVHLFISMGIGFFVFRTVGLKIPRLQKWVLFKNEIAEEVSEGAMEAFHRYQLHKTEEHNGILIYLSQFERQIHLLVDEGVLKIWEQTERDEWVARVISHIKQGQTKVGILQGIDEISLKVNEHFPVRSENPNELKNVIID